MCYTYLAPVSIYKKKFKGSYFQFPDFWSIFYKGKSNYRTGNDIDMKLGSATKLKKNTATSKNLTMTNVHKL